MTSLPKPLKPFVAILGLFFYVVLHLWLPVCTVALAENVDDSSVVTVKSVPFGYKKLTIKLFEEPEARLEDSPAGQIGLKPASETHILLPHRCNGIPGLGAVDLSAVLINAHFSEWPHVDYSTLLAPQSDTRTKALLAKPPPYRLQALRAHETIVLRI